MARHRTNHRGDEHDRLIRLEADVELLKKLVYGAVSVILAAVLGAVMVSVLR